MPVHLVDEQTDEVDDQLAGDGVKRLLWRVRDEVHEGIGEVVEPPDISAGVPHDGSFTRLPGADDAGKCATADGVEWRGHGSWIS